MLVIESRPHTFQMCNVNGLQLLNKPHLQSEYFMSHTNIYLKD